MGAQLSSLAESHSGREDSLREQGAEAREGVGGQVCPSNAFGGFPLLGSWMTLGGLEATENGSQLVISFVHP